MILAVGIWIIYTSNALDLWQFIYRKHWTYDIISILIDLWISTINMAMSQRDTPAFAGNTSDPHITLSPFGHTDGDFAFNPLSTNRRLPDHPDLPVLGTVVLAGPSPDTIHVMIPDSLIPSVGTDVHIDLRHVVTLQLGPATDIGTEFPPSSLARALYSKPLRPTLMLQGKDYWDEINPFS